MEPSVRKGCRPVDRKFPIIAILGQKGSHWPNGHNGWDFLNPKFTDVRAFDDGFADRYETNHKQLGNYLRIRHKWGYTIYAHLDGPLVKVGDKVKRGEVIAKSGESGTFYDGRFHPHTHFGCKTILDYKNIPVEFEEG